MKAERFFAPAVTVLLTLCLAVPFLSWLLWSLGMDVRSLYSDEGLRWVFQRLPGLTFGPVLQACLLLAWAAAVWRRVWLSGEAGRALPAVAATCVLGLLMGGLLMAMAFGVRSPLLSITGTVAGSPLLHGLPVVVPVMAGGLGLLHGLLTRMVRTPTQLSGLLCAAFSDSPALLACMVMASCCWQCVAYMLGA